VYELTLNVHSLLRWLVVLVGLLRRCARSAPWSVAVRGPARRQRGSLVCDERRCPDADWAGVVRPAEPDHAQGVRQHGRGHAGRHHALLAVEHVSLMLIALAMVHVGRSRSRKGATSAAKHRSPRSSTRWRSRRSSPQSLALPAAGSPLLPGSELGSTLASCTSVAWGGASGRRRD